MKGLKIGETVFSIHPLAILAAAVMALGGKAEMLLAYTAALALHETGHFIAATHFRCAPERMEITPFGALAAVEGYGMIEPRQQFTIALFGPLGNLLALLVLMSLFYLNIATSFMVSLFKANVFLFAFNLLPVLPMDGGRMLHGILQKYMDRQRSARVLTGIGMLCGAAIAGMAAIGAMMLKTLNLSMLFTGVYLIYAAAKMKQSALAQYLHSVIATRAKFEKNGILPCAFVAASSQLTVRELMEKLPLGQRVRIIVIDESTLNEMGEITQEAFEKAVFSMADAPIAKLV
jgi:Zn-dependent proteases